MADFIDPDIAAKLEALEAEEEKLEAEGFYASDDSMVRLYQHILNTLVISSLSAGLGR